MFAMGFFEQAFGMFMIMVVLVIWGIKKAASSDAAKDAAKIGFWWWLTKDD